MSRDYTPDAWPNATIRLYSPAGIDPSKRRIGIVVTFEPFFLNQNWLIREQLAKAEFPVGVVSFGEMEKLVLLRHL